MKFKFTHILIFFFLFSCTINNINEDKITVISKKNYTSKGFSLIYEESLYKKKMITKKLNNKKYEILHSFLKPKTLLKIINPNNSKSIIAIVKSNANYSPIYNSVINKKIANYLDLDIDNPFVEIFVIKKNNIFIAKKAKTFDEEKKVANKVPVSDINIKVISDVEKEPKKEKSKIKYIINIGEFYYLNSAKSLKNRIKTDTSIKNIKIQKLSDKKYRIYSGPFDSFSAIKDTYFKINQLGFESLDILKIN